MRIALLLSVSLGCAIVGGPLAAADQASAGETAAPSEQPTAAEPTPPGRDRVAERVHQLVRDGGYTITDVRVRVGNAVPVKDARIGGYHDDDRGITVDQVRAAESQFSFHGEGQYTIAHLGWGNEYMRAGWCLGAGVAFDSHRGDVYNVDEGIGPSRDVSERIRVDALSATVMAGGAVRFDVGRWHGLLPRTVQLELGPFVAAGPCLAQVDGVSDNTSDVGTYLRYGALVASSFAVTEDARFEVALSYQAFAAEVEWDNTDSSTIEGQGVALSLGAIFEL
ncbi:MAG: hypothetical protein ACOCZK_02250 [Planctomycetota bacterium]